MNVAYHDDTTGASIEVSTLHPLPVTSSGGSAVTVADGANVTFGAEADAAAATDTSTATYMSLFKRLLQRITTFIGLFPTSLGQKTMANGLAVTVASDQSAVPFSVADGSDATQGAKADAAATADTGTFSVVAILKRALAKTGTGAANIATGQAATSTVAATLVIARATRRYVTVKNLDTAITVYVGPATVTSGNGLPLAAGESVNIPWTGLVQVISASATPNVAYADFWD